MLGFVGTCPSVWYVGLCGHLSVSLICWALWAPVRQSDMLGFVGTCPSVWYVGLCGHLSVSLICCALWAPVCQSDMLGFVGTCPSVWYVGFVGTCPDVWYVGLCGHLSVSLIRFGLCGHLSVSLICWGLWALVRQSDSVDISWALIVPHVHYLYKRIRLFILLLSHSVGWDGQAHRRSYWNESSKRIRIKWDLTVRV